MFPPSLPHLFPFQAISWMLFLNPLLLLCTQGWIPAPCVVGAVTSCKVLSTSFTWSAQKKEVCAMFKDTQITIMYEDKGSQGKSRMQALLEKDLERERVYSHTPQSDFTLAHPKPVSGSRAQFCKPCTTNTSLASRYSVCCWPGVTLQVNLPS